MCVTEAERYRNRDRQTQIQTGRQRQRKREKQRERALPFFVLPMLSTFSLIFKFIVKSTCLICSFKISENSISGEYDHN